MCILIRDEVREWTAYIKIKNWGTGGKFQPNSTKIWSWLLILRERKRYDLEEEEISHDIVKFHTGGGGAEKFFFSIFTDRRSIICPSLCPFFLFAYFDSYGPGDISLSELFCFCPCERGVDFFLFFSTAGFSSLYRIEVYAVIIRFFSFERCPGTSMRGLQRCACIVPVELRRGGERIVGRLGRQDKNSNR